MVRLMLPVVLVAGLLAGAAKASTSNSITQGQASGQDTPAIGQFADPWQIAQSSEAEREARKREAKRERKARKREAKQEREARKRQAKRQREARKREKERDREERKRQAEREREEWKQEAEREWEYEKWEAERELDEDRWQAEREREEWQREREERQWEAELERDWNQGQIGATPSQGENELLGGILGLAIGALGANQLSRQKQPEQPTYFAPPPPAYQQGYAPPPPAYQQGYAAPPPTQGYVPPPPPTAYRQSGQAVAPQPAPPVQAAFDTSYCREYTTTTVIDGTEQKSHGTACRQVDGTWRIVN